MSKLKLLVADDDKFVRSLYEKGLSKEIFDVQMATNGEKALSIYNSWKPDLMLMDIIMPIMTGYQLLKKIREEEPYKKICENENEKITVIIMVTALGKKEDIIDCLKIGIHGYIVKPFEYKKITRRVMETYKRVYPENREAEK